MDNYQFINLQAYVNHKIIGKETEVKKITQLENIGIKNNLFLPELLPESNTMIHINKIPFIFPDKEIDKYDNIQCEEQAIDINGLKSNQICFLGLSEEGDHRDYINILYEDGSVDNVCIFFYDWLMNRGIMEGVTDIWECDIQDERCRTAMISNVSLRKKRRVFLYECMLNRYNCGIKRIKLPYNPQMHIIAITVKGVSYEG